MKWSWLRFADLGVHNLYDAMALRCSVFSIEQQCVYMDADGVDPVCWHLLGRDDAGTLQAYLRLVDPGVKYAEPSIGRVITSLEKRRTGLGRVLMKEGITRCQSVWPGQGITINAQARLREFYLSFGFVPVGDEYMDDGIPHLRMLRSPP